MIVLVLASACASTSSAGPDTTEDTADSTSSGITVVTNALVYTLDPELPWADAFAYNADGVLLAVGVLADVFAITGDEVDTIDADGWMIIPGFQDAHVHVPEAGINASLCFMSGQDLGRLETQARDCANDQPDDEWVRAAGPSLFGLRDTAELPIDVLDRAIPDRPALILDDLGHAVWTNTLGLEAAGIGPDDPDPQGGVLHRDVESGRLTGLLLEDAQQLVRNAAALDDQANYDGLLDALSELNQKGVTSVSDAGGYWAQNHPTAWERALNEKTLTVRGANSLYLYPDLEIDEQLDEFRTRFSDDSDLLRFDTAKIYIDGILDLGTASMLDPYNVPLDPLYPSGFTYFTADQLQTYVSALHDIGYRINFHVIGDAGVRAALDAIEEIDDDPEAIADRRHRTTHTYLVDLDDVPRFAALGVLVDMQQSDDAVATDYHEFLSEFIGDRAFDLIPTRQLIDANATVTLSSDWDAGPLPPLGTIERSLTREANAVPDLETALHMHTLEAAYALGHDDTTGSLEVGKFADFVVLDRNLFDLDREDIDQTRVLATFLAGDEVYSSPRWTQLGG